MPVVYKIVPSFDRTRDVVVFCLRKLIRLDRWCFSVG